MLMIRGIEVSQAIQYYRADQHLTDPADRGPDNSLELVAGKPAWVRVYVENDAPGEIQDIIGTLEVRYGILNERFEQPPITLNPQPDLVRARFEPGYTAQRFFINWTVNFIIPAERMFGPLLLLASVNSGAGTVPAVMELAISATLRQTLKVRGIMIGYNGPDPRNPGTTLTLAPPMLVGLGATAVAALNMMPVQSDAVFQVASTLTRTQPLTGLITGGGCPEGWVSLNAAIATAKVADGNRPGFLYYGLLPGAFPNLTNAGGCAAGGVASGKNGDIETFVHEIGHLCGRDHAPCGSPGGPDPNYPAYEPYDTPANRSASIGEYGLVITYGGVVLPSTSRDYMSYCGPGWISIYGHQALINNGALNPEQVGVARPWWKDIHEYDPWWWLHYRPDPPYWIDAEHIRKFPAPWHEVISVIGMLHADEQVEILSVTRTQVLSAALGGSQSELRLVLHGAGGVEIASAFMREMNSHACCGGCGGCGGEKQRPVLLQAFLPDVATGSGLSIRRGNVALWKRAATRGKLSVSAPKVRRSNQDDAVEVSWTAKPPRAVQDTWVRVSADEGKTWRSAATSITRSPAVLHRTHLPAGKLLVQVVVHDGFRSVPSKSVEFDNEALPPLPTILHPNSRARLVAGRTLCLWGSLVGHVDETSGDFRFTWTVDGKAAGEGLQLFTRTPAPGKHRCQLAVVNAKGQVVRYSDAEFVSVSAEDAEAR